MSEKIKEKLKTKLKDYCELGNWLFSENIKVTDKILRTKNEVFYPITDSSDTYLLYSGKFEINEVKTYAVHWFGGHPNSQKFNSYYTEKFAKISNDSISKFIRKIGLV